MSSRRRRRSRNRLKAFNPIPRVVESFVPIRRSRRLLEALPVLSLDRPKTRAIRRRTPPSRVPRQIVQSKVFPRKRARYVLGAVRREVQIPECARRKVFKATMMRKLAAQAAGRGGVKRWRRTLKRGSAVRVQNNC